MSPAFETRSLDRGDCRMVYDRRVVPGAPAVVLLHGYGVDRSMWGPTLPALEGYTVFNVDLRGHGDSRPCARFSIPLAAEDIHALLAAEGVDRPVLAGLSMGGYVAQEYAWRYGGAAGYWLTGTTPVLLDCYAGWERWTLEHSTPMLRPFPWGFLKGWMSRASSSTAEGRRAVRAMFDRLSREEFLRGWDGVAHCLHPEVGFRFDAPVLVTRGEYDRLGSIRRYMGQWERAYPGARALTIPGASHVANLDAPEEFNRLLRGFVEQCMEARACG